MIFYFKDGRCNPRQKWSRTARPLLTSSARVGFRPLNIAAGLVMTKIRLRVYRQVRLGGNS